MKPMRKSNLKTEILGYKGGDKIDISTLPKGDYILLVSYGKKSSIKIDLWSLNNFYYD